jgi:hypothetical protein
MTPECEQALSYVSQGTGLIGVLALYVGSLGFPFEKRSWKGKTPAEGRHKRRQQVLKWVGLPCVFISVGCQTAITVFGA